MDGRSTTRWFAALAAAGLLTSCSFHIGTGAATMPKDKLETAVKSKLSTKTTSTIDSVVCDGGLGRRWEQLRRAPLSPARRAVVRR